MDLLERERETYRQMWAVDEYAQHSPGEHYLPIFLDMIGVTRCEDDASVLDAGCGSGQGGVALSRLGFNVLLCDVTPDGLVSDAMALPYVDACLWHDLRVWGPFDYVYCCDVLEHIPTAFTMLVVRRLLDVAAHGVFLSISFQPDVMGHWVGTPLHQTVMPFTWWRDALSAVGEVIEARDLLNAGVFFVRRRD